MKRKMSMASLLTLLGLAAFPVKGFADSGPLSPGKLSAGVASKMAVLKKEILKLSPISKVKPALEWKYGWQDRSLANLIGKPSAHSLVPAASSTLASGYAPADLSSAYGFDLIPTNGDGSGQIIAIVDAYGSRHLQSDLDTFNTQYALPSNTVSVVYPEGKPTNSDSGWAGETTLDVEWAHAVAPGASILLVVAHDDSLSSILKAVIYAATNANVVSMSWSTSEFQGQTKYDAAFSIPGVTFVAASGDSGAGVNWPASSPNVLGVGGTTLTYDSNSGVVSEVGWSGSGGGISTVEQLPAYQAGWNVNFGRGVPDVSYDADPYTGVSVFFTDPTSTNAGGWFVFGGTSAGTPQWAALVACRESLGNQGTNSFNSVIYANASSSYSTILNDITQGQNGYPAVSGYDLVTGLGTPVANQIAALPDALPTPTPSPTPSPTPIVKHGPPPGQGSGDNEGDGNGGYANGQDGSWFNQLRSWLNQFVNWFNNWFGSTNNFPPPQPSPTPSPTPVSTPTPTPSPTATPVSQHFGHSGRY